ncbi:MAG TPA: hypothetical protein VNW06_11865, partial [Cytophagaceae bacterium]|nr:hypothetical protein [Cytophagaceae bacterium]
GLPFKISFLQKDGIVFICNTKEQVDIILNGKVTKGISKEKMKSMSANTVNLFVDIKKIFSLIPKKENYQYNRTSNDLLSYTSNNVGQLSVLQAKPSDNTIHSEFMLTLPDGKENAVKYFFDFINEFYTSTLQR